MTVDQHHTATSPVKNYSADAYIDVRADDFDVGVEYAHLATGTQAGAVVTFVGRVRDFSGAASRRLWLEHYPGMTEKVITDIVAQAQARWPIQKTRVIHRIGELTPGDQIVLVGVSAAHRQDAFDACAFIMDFLKTQAPFWKKEGDHWVAAKQSDLKAAHAWTESD